MKNKKRNSKNKGITLVALILTIVVLVILATITIQEVSGDGIFSKAKESARKTDVADTIEKIKLEMLNNIMEKEENKKTEEEIIAKYAQDGKIYYNQNNEAYILTAKGNKVLISEITGITGKELILETNFKDGRYSTEKAVNSPKLANGMKAVYWDENNNEIKEGDANFNIQNWYSYEVQTGATTNGGTSKWANAKTEDGSYWVWIPRYEYKIDSTNKTIDVNFIPTSQIAASQGYIIHPAFQNGTSTNYMNGEWDAEISGIWVAKYEMSMETSSDSGATWTATKTSDSTVGNVSISQNSIRMVSKPNVSSWRHITIGNMYTNCLNYDSHLGYTSLDSHLMKNSEWGAVAYLTHSKYGRNGTEISVNTSSSFVTAKGEVLASTTGNITGVYDLSGGAWEYVAAYVSDGSSKLGTNGSSFANTTADTNGYKTYSTKYVTAYPYDSSSDSSADNYTVYRNLKSTTYGYGDALTETEGWNEDCADFAHSSNPFFLRGGYYSGGATAGVFYSYYNFGSALYYSGFRAVIVVE